MLLTKVETDIVCEALKSFATSAERQATKNNKSRSHKFARETEAKARQARHLIAKIGG